MRRRLTWVVAAILASAICWFASAEARGIWPLAWLAPAPVLAVAFGSSAVVAAATAFAAFFLGALGNWPVERAVLLPGVILVFHAVRATVFALVTLQAQRVVRAHPQWPAVFAFPVTATAVAFLVSIAWPHWPHGTGGSLAYGQAEFLPLIQVVSLVGLSGITFLLSLVPAGFAVGWYLRNDRRQAVSAVAAPLALLALTLAFGGWRLAQPCAGRSVRVGLAVTDETLRFFNAQRREAALPVLRAYARRIGVLADRGAQLVVLPEKFVGVTPEYLADALAIMADAARAHRVTVIGGVNRIGGDEKRNTAYVFSPDGDLRLAYDKAFPVPFFEDGYRRGTAPGIVGTTAGLSGIAICKDMMFPRWKRAYGQAGVGVMLVPAWDFGRDGHLGARIAVLRGVEGGYAVVRAAQEGRLTVSDTRGRILAEASSADAPEVLLTADVPVEPVRTLYARTGDWFAWLTVAAAALLVAAVR